MSLAPGSVWWCKVDFRDGEGERKKYFVVLTDCFNAEDEMWMPCTTSQGHKRYPSTLTKGSSPCGCPKDSCFRIDGGQEDCFPAPTWVQFDNAATMTHSDLREQEKAGKASFVQALQPERLRSILNCAKKSKDIRKAHLTGVERTLKALNPVKGMAKPPTPAVAHAGLVLAAHIDRYCAGCRAEFQDLVGVDLAPLKADQEPTEKFLEDIRVGIDMIKHCANCALP